MEEDEDALTFIVEMDLSHMIQNRAPISKVIKSPYEHFSQ